MISRKSFLAIGLGITGLLTSLQWWVFPKSQKKQKSLKFLMHDGKLVEVDLKNIPKKKITASKQQFVSWVWIDQKL